MSNLWTRFIKKCFSLPFKYCDQTPPAYKSAVVSLSWQTSKSLHKLHQNTDKKGSGVIFSSLESCSKHSGVGFLF